jgi:hypothetical protein
MGLFGDAWEAIKLFRLYRRLKGRVRDMRGIDWRSARFRLGVGAIVAAILGIAAGEINLIEWIQQNTEVVALVFAGLFSIFAGAGTKRVEKQNRELKDELSAMRLETGQKIESVAREVRLVQPNGVDVSGGTG